MAITFSITKKTAGKAEGTLSWPEKGLSSPAVSGPYGKGIIELGTYHAERKFLLDKNEDAYRDVNNNCWFQRLDPKFPSTRTEIGIHPDGNVSGTEGCIGLIIADTKPWYKALYSVGASSHTVVEVVENLFIASEEK
jgi:hypothetical protein